MRKMRLLRAVPVLVPALLVVTGLTATAEAQPVSSHDAVWRPVSPGSVQAKKLSRNVTDKVIVVLKNQLSGLPDTPANSARRSAAVASVQQGVLADLAATHAAHVKSISLVNAVAATVSSGEARHLASDPAVAEVVPDLPIPVLGSSPTAEAIKAAKAEHEAAGIKPLRNTCPSGKTVQLNPEAVETIHAATQSGKGDSAQALGYTGAGVKVAWIADGLNVNNPDFIRANGKHVFVDYQDFSGTGTSAPTDGGEAFLDASSIAAQGREVYNVQDYGIGLSVPCRIRILGVAPGASLVGLNVFGSADLAFNSVFLEAINYAVTVDHVNVINESFGSNPFPDAASLDLTREADDAAVKAGVTVTVSSGDAGPTDTIGSPATDPHVISAGASTTLRAYAQTGIGGITYPGVKGWIDNNISGLSSGGFDQTGGTVDVVAPGDLNWALCTPRLNLYAACGNFDGNPASVELSGGTSEAAPLTAGVAALVIQAYAESHHGHHPSPAVVKKIIVSTAQNIGAPAEQQGAGLIDAYAAVQAARSYTGGTQSKAGHAVLDSSTQLNAVAPAGAVEHLTDTLTNDGSGSVTVHLSTHTLSSYSTIASGNLKLTAKQGFTAVEHFHVAPGQARLNVSVASQASAEAVVNISLVAPDGDLAEYNLPQGFGNYGNAQVANPAAGTWTALIQTEPLADVSSQKAEFQASTATWKPFGTLSASTVTLPPGASRGIGLTVSTPAQPGDESGSIVLRTAAEATTIPVTLRSLVPAPPVTFSGTLTGGNGRESNTGQTNYYEFSLPASLPMLNVTVSMPTSANTFFAELVGPSGQAEATGSNGLLGANGAGDTTQIPEDGTELHVMNPAAGRWTLVIDFYNTVSGTATEQTFSVSMNTAAPTAGTTGLPDNFADTLTRGAATTADVSVTNTSSVPEQYFVDARLNGEKTLTLATQTMSQIVLPNLAGAVPTYLVPSLTKKVTAKVTAPSANFFDLSYPFGDPDLISSTGKTSSVTFAPSGDDVANGDWTVTPFLKGPDGKNGAKPVLATVAVTAQAPAVDPAVSSSTGDLWSASTNPGAGFTPVTVLPGQEVTIQVTFTPSGAVGSQVSGTLYVASSSFNSGLVTSNELPDPGYPSASNVAAFPYAYTVGS